MKFFICRHCGKIIGVLKREGVPTICCGDVMDELIPNTAEASQEKHIPVVKQEENLLTVQVGAVLHPATEEHNIEWVYLQTQNGGQRKKLGAGKEPVAKFSLVDDKPVAVYAYCNLHGLWKKEI